MTRRPKIVVFEDESTTCRTIISGLRRMLRGFEIVAFAGTTDSSDSGAYEDRIRVALSSGPYSDPVLIVCDRDLSRVTGYTGLSEAVISNAAANLGLPVCLYAQGIKDDPLSMQRTWGDARIVLDSSDLGRMLGEIGVLARGFQAVQKQVAALTTANSQRTTPPLAVLAAKIMGRPEAAEQVAMYGSGDQKMVSLILRSPKAGSAPNRQSALRGHLPTLVGVWMYDSILRYPGLLVNPVAAASHLNISVQQFASEAKIQALFKNARYKGPFDNPDEPLWWRSLLDDLVVEAKCEDGREFAQQRLRKRIKSCRCSLDNTKRAGYYCMATKTPISMENGCDRQRL